MTLVEIHPMTTNTEYLTDAAFLEKVDQVIRKANTPERHSPVVFWFPGHPLAGSAGIVSASRHIASVELGRWLTPRECVSFRDGDRQNLSSNNLEVLTTAELMLRNFPYLGNNVEAACAVCGRTYSVPLAHASRRKTCSEACGGIHRRKFEIDRQELQELVITMPMIALAKNLGVSDVAVAKRCKKLGVLRPPRGYWRKIEVKKLEPRQEQELSLAMLRWVQAQGDAVRADPVWQIMLSDVLDEKLKDL